MPAKASRAAFGEALLDLGARDERIVTLDADLSKSTMTIEFVKAHPDRAFNVGIAESNMIGIGAGLALTGKIPFVCSFACFVVGRFETIRISVAYTNANVKIVGTHSGIAIGEDGYSQMGLEDIACLRSLPNIPIIQPADELETKQAVAFAVEHDGPLYLRLTRQNLEPVCPPDYRFQLGRWLDAPSGPRRDGHRQRRHRVQRAGSREDAGERRDLGRGHQRRIDQAARRGSAACSRRHGPATW